MIWRFVGVVVSSMKMLVHSRQDGDAGRAAMCAVGIGRCESHPSLGERIHVGCLQKGFSGTGDAACIVLIGQDKENVRSSR